MRNLIQILFVALLIVSCNKDTVPAPKTPVIPEPVKWEVIPGDYKVYDTTGLFLYDMNISHSIGNTTQGYRTDSLHYTNFYGNFDITAVQSQYCTNPNCIKIGSYEELYDSIDNRWNIFDYGSDSELNNFRNDSIVLYFEIHNTPYWLNDGTTYYHKILKHIAVKQP